MNNRIIIVGGMGPQASLELHRRILARAVQLGAKNGYDFPEIYHLSLPIDDNNFIGKRADAQQAKTAIVNALEYLRPSNQDKIVLACNTIHLILPEIEQRLHIRCMSLIDQTVQHVRAENVRTVGLLASPMTILTNLYENPLRANGVEVIVPSDSQQLVIENVIRGVIAGEPLAPLRKKLQPIIRSLRAKGAETILLGCTELSVVFADAGGGFIDPLQLITAELLGDDNE